MCNGNLPNEGTRQRTGKTLGRCNQIQAGLKINTGRIDGGVIPALRHRVLSDLQIVVFTPDIIHAWLLSNLSNKKVLSFLEKVDLIVVDEVHTYSGVFVFSIPPFFLEDYSIYFIC